MRNEAARTRPFPDTESAAVPRPLPPGLPLSTVSEIASWLVGHTIDAVERELIRHTLESCEGDRELAAKLLGLSQPALRRKLRGHALSEARAQESEQANDNEDVAAAPPIAPEPEPAAAPEREPRPATVPAIQEKATMLDFRLLIGGVIAVAAVALLALRLFGADAGTERALPERPRLELSIPQKPWHLPGPMPAWAAAPHFAAPDIAADTRMDSAPAQATAVAAIGAFDPAQDARMDPAAADIAQDTRMDSAAVDIAQDTRMESAAVDVAQDTRMESAAVDVAQDTRMESAAIDVAQDTRMETAAAPEADGAPEITGSVGGVTSAKADAPAPVARAADAAPVAREAKEEPAPRPARPARAAARPVQTAAAKPDTETRAPFPFPFFFLAPNGARSAAGTNVNSGPPCCVRSD